MPYLTDEFGNPNSQHSLGRSARKAVERAREQVAEFINASPEQIIFTSSGSESNQMALYSHMMRKREQGKCSLTYGIWEHNSVTSYAKHLEKYYDVKLYTKESFDSGNFVNCTNVKGYVTTLMRVNNETGVIYPVPKVGDLCKQNNILFHADYVQAVSSEAVDVERICCDTLSFSGHKIGAPKGVGVLYIREPDLFIPTNPGSDSQEYGLRCGTQNVPAIVGIGEACRLLKGESEKTEKNSQDMKDFLTRRLMDSEMGKRGLVTINTSSTLSTEKILSISFKNIDGEILSMALDREGIQVSTGSACDGNKRVISGALLSIGAVEAACLNTIRVSYGDGISKDVLLKVIERIVNIASVLSNKIE